MAYGVLSGKANPAQMGGMALLWSILATIIAGITGYYITQHTGKFNGYYWYAFGGYLPGCLLVSFFMALFYAQKNFWLPNMLMSLVIFVLITLTFYSEKLGISLERYINLYFTAFLIQGVVLAAFYLSKYRLHNIFSIPRSGVRKVVVTYSIVAFGANLLYFLLFRIDYWFVQHYCAEGDLGNYIQVSKIVQLFLTVPAMIAGAVFPFSATRLRKDVQNRIALLSRAAVFAFSGVCLLLTLSGYWLFPFIFGNSFAQMYQLLLLLIPGIISLVIVSLISAYFAGQNQVWVNVFGCLCGLFILVPGDILMVPLMGVKGAAIIASLSYCATLGCLLYFFIKNSECRLSDFFILKSTDIQALNTSFNKVLNRN